MSTVSPAFSDSQGTLPTLVNGFPSPTSYVVALADDARPIARMGSDAIASKRTKVLLFMAFLQRLTGFAFRFSLRNATKRNQTKVLIAYNNFRFPLSIESVEGGPER